jgi:hypothetical protein
VDQARAELCRSERARGVRSLNLANTVALCVYTAMHRAGAPMPDNDGAYAPHPERERDAWPADVLRPD